MQGADSAGGNNEIQILGGPGVNTMSDIGAPITIRAGKGWSNTGSSGNGGNGASIHITPGQGGNGRDPGGWPAGDGGVLYLGGGPHGTPDFAFGGVDGYIDFTTNAQFDSGKNLTFTNGSVLGAVNLLTISSNSASYLGISSATNSSLALAGTTTTAKVGGSTLTVRVGGTIFDIFSSSGNNGTAATDLYISSVPAFTLNTNGDKLIFTVSGTYTGSTSSKDLQIFVGTTTVYDSGALAVSTNGSWFTTATIVRDSNTTVRIGTLFTDTGATPTTPANYTTVGGLNLIAQGFILKIVGTASGVGAATNDAIAQFGTVEWKAAKRP